MRYPRFFTKLFLAVFLSFLLSDLSFPTSLAQGPTTVTVDTTSAVIDGDTSSVEALLANRGSDGEISFTEALAAINRTGPGYTIKFNLPHGAIVEAGSSLSQSYTTIDGDVDRDTKPDIAVLENRDHAASLYIYSDHNIVKNIVMENIYIWGANAHHNIIANCYIGTNVEGKEGNTVVNNGVQIVNGAHHNIVENNIIAGNVNVPYDSDDIMSGIVLDHATDNEIRGNWIGVDVDGERLPNDAGVYVGLGSQRNAIGGERDTTNCHYPCNVISGNLGSGIIIHGSTTISNTVQGNYVGVSPDGTTAMPNGRYGFPAVYLRCGTSENIIGGERDSIACNGPCNVISGNTYNGVELRASGSGGNLIQGNYIGVSPDGNSRMSNGQYGVYLQDRPDRFCTLPAVTSNNLLGGERPSKDCTGPCNVISGGISSGIMILGIGSTNNVVQGNFIGLDATGTYTVPNRYGVRVSGGSENTIGGDRASADCSGPCNVISGNDATGISIEGTAALNNTVQGNFIGVDPTGTKLIPNKIGVRVVDGAENTIGGDRAPGSCDGPCNLISGNDESGVLVTGNDANGNTLRGNEIWANGGLGIDLGGDGVTRNDSGDADDGPNGGMNYPVGVTAVYDAGTDRTTVSGRLDTHDPAASTVDVYASDRIDPSGYGEGQLYLGQVTPRGDGHFELAIPGQLVYGFLSATATDADGATSEFGPRPPLILIPGVAGSELVNGQGGDVLWFPPLGLDFFQRIRRLNLYPDGDPPPSPDIYAADALWDVPPVLDLIRPLRDFLTSASGGDYKLYQNQFNFELHPPALTCKFDKDQHPSLFVFPFDWRKSIADHSAGLREYIACIQEFYPGSEVDIVAHSTGSLLARRYILDYPDDHQVNKLVSIGAPWLGAAKMIYVLETGDFMDKRIRLNLKDFAWVSGSMTGTHQLLPSRAYYDLLGGSPIVEEGWDFDDDGTKYDEGYSYDHYLETLDDIYGGPAFSPGQAVQQFHDLDHQGQQDNWRGDTSGVDYYHIVGIQAGENTIGRIGTTARWVCERYSIGNLYLCVPRKVLWLRKHLTMGDHTVPWLSSLRLPYNAPDACLITLYGPQAGGDEAVEHNGLNGNPLVHDTLLTLLGAGYTPYQHFYYPQYSRCVPRTFSGVSAAALPAPRPQHYLTILGGASTVVSDTLGNSTAPISETLSGHVPGVDAYVLGANAEFFVMSSQETYTVSFTTTPSPLAIELTTGTSNSASRAIRFMDVSLPPSVTAQLTVDETQGGTLRYDGDGDGVFESTITATVAVSGPLANDLEPPVISVDEIQAQTITLVTLSAQDTGSGVSALYYSLDGMHFQPYVETLQIDPAQTPIIYGFADDNVANRATLVYPLSLASGDHRIYLPVILKNR